MNASFDEPTIPPRLQRPLAAVWISLGLHAVVIALVQVAPPAAISLGEPVIEARLVSTPAAPRTPEVKTPEVPPKQVRVLAPSETAEALPVARPAPSPVQVEPPAAPLPPVVPAPAESHPGLAAAPSVAARPAPDLSINSSVDLTYYSARDVEVQPRALREIVPDYPADADRRRLSGKVRLQLKLEADGRIVDIEVVSASPPGLFEDSAKQAFHDARFSPAQKNGHPVRALVLIEVVYDWAGQPH
ncbi:MAG: energy transducer TonB [Thiobacillus sp.]